MLGGDLHRCAAVVMIMDLNHICAFNASSNLSILKNLFHFQIGTFTNLKILL
jgi:hypothetical protein